ncbi:hypothetical protein [Ferrimicrobium acidiphilum]|uniref:hypothetical protein n=1 Tax=Ferrimicrobium acidiphilum TaxID=121039 RepID=UPI0023F426CB|nr:hypothetical protein [Ferrimicrobium acidiphilum]
MDVEGLTYSILDPSYFATVIRKGDAAMPRVARIDGYRGTQFVKTVLRPTIRATANHPLLEAKVEWLIAPRLGATLLELQNFTTGIREHKWSGFISTQNQKIEVLDRRAAADIARNLSAPTKTRRIEDSLAQWIAIVARRRHRLTATNANTTEKRLLDLAINCAPLPEYPRLAGGDVNHIAWAETIRIRALAALALERAVAILAASEDPAKEELVALKEIDANVARIQQEWLRITDSKWWLGHKHMPSQHYRSALDVASEINPQHIEKQLPNILNETR